MAISVSQDPKRIQVDQRLLNLIKSADYVAVNFEAPVRGVGKLYIRVVLC